MDIEIVTDHDRFQRLGPAWHDLWHRSRASIFQSYPWVSAWWRECNTKNELRIACAWHGEQLIGILPCSIQRYHGVRILEWAAQPYSDYCDAITCDPTVLEPLWATLFQTGTFDLYRMKHVTGDANMRPVLERQSMCEREEICLQVVRDWPDGDSWFRTLNKKTRNNHSRGWRILREQGDFQVCLLGPQEPREPVIQHLVNLKRTWEANRNAPLVRSDTMLQSLAEALDRLDSLRVFLLRHRDKIIAGSVNAVQAGKMLALFATYDRSFERGSPGIVVMTEYTKWAFDHGFSEVDYLLGAETYKFKFANHQTKLAIFLAARTRLGSAALSAYRWTRRDENDTSTQIGSAYRTQNGHERNAVVRTTCLT